ncbi:hypothetical protein P171DRAFT_382825 [Karstenula rhodostoma CBS 690.94]|uniref:Oxidase ustYa n=1 Tax=Karstenula rhodostoma CBS 690.94 TaxID=1392251 RepID=A0A9P4PPG0_9PLEO|nr:hypothetical protein P171DRAFT_382825 [Karstenula rhodostoma CBS 690.94]
MKQHKEVLDEEEEAFLSSHHEAPMPEPCRTRWRAKDYIRLFIELAMACTIAALLVRQSTSASGCSPIRRTPMPQLSRKLYTFQSNPRYTPEDMFTNKSTTLHTLHNWIELSSAGRGYVVAPSSGNYDLPKPYTIAIDRHNNGPGYMISVFHQLHCLSYLAVHFQEGYDGVKLQDEIAHHSVHCFNYLRQGITCNADTTLEGQTDAGPGEGSEHECVDYDALLEWANEKAGMRWRDGLLPEEATL